MEIFTLMLFESESGISLSMETPYAIPIYKVLPYLVILMYILCKQLIIHTLVGLYMTHHRHIVKVHLHIPVHYLLPSQHSTTIPEM